MEAGGVSMIKNMKLYISHEIKNPDAWICICGNTPEADGFDTCLPDGRRIDPEGPWQDHFLCNRCESVINQTTVELAWQRGKQ